MTRGGIGDATHGPQKRLPTSLTQAYETKEIKQP